jgi:hypothetical protein
MRRTACGNERMAGFGSLVNRAAYNINIDTGHSTRNDTAPGVLDYHAAFAVVFLTG